MSTIDYREMIKAIDAADHESKGRIESLIYIPADKTRNKGGNWVELTDVQKCGLPYHCNDNEMRGFVGRDGKVMPVHLRLIFEFNRLTVYP